jgi:hypothetical protein
LGDTLRKQFMSSNGGASGKFGTAFVQGDIARRGDLSNTDTQFAQTAASLPLQASTLAEQLLGMNFGQTTNSNQNASSDYSSQQSTRQTAGNPASTGIGTFLGLLGGLL